MPGGEERLHVLNHSIVSATFRLGPTIHIGRCELHHTPGASEQQSRPRHLPDVPPSTPNRNSLGLPSLFLHMSCPSVRCALGRCPHPLPPPTHQSFCRRKCSLTRLGTDGFRIINAKYFMHHSPCLSHHGNVRCYGGYHLQHL